MLRVDQLGAMAGVHQVFGQGALGVGVLALVHGRGQAQAALKRVRNDMGLTNVEIMVPFVRTLGQAEAVGALLAKDFDERDSAVKAKLAMSIKACLQQGKHVGICGQGTSDYPDFAKWLVEQGITSISLNPDSVVETWKLPLSHSQPVPHSASWG
jgi:phosphoenolpyruvate synthase/pyruvate phosphate dikinase